MKPRNLLDILADQINEGKITIATAALELYRHGWFSYIPTVTETRNLLLNRQRIFFAI